MATLRVDAISKAAARACARRQPGVVRVVSVTEKKSLSHPPWKAYEIEVEYEKEEG